MKSVSNREAKSIVNREFKEAEDGDIYWDPAGYRTGQPINLKQDAWENNKELFERFDELQDEGYDIRTAAEKIAEEKSMTTSAWEIPTYYIPDVHFINPKHTPMADLIAREVTKTDTVRATNIAGTIDPNFTSEATSYTEKSIDNEFSESEYSIKMMEFEIPISDKMATASQPLRNSQAVVEELMMNSIRYAEEKQIFHGQTSPGDSDGFEGIPDINTTAYEQTDSLTDHKSTLRGLIDDLEKAGAQRDKIAVFMAWDEFSDLKDTLDSKSRYQVVEDNKNTFGFNTLEFDGVPVFTTHAFQDSDERGDNEPYVAAVDMSSVFMGMLSDVTVRTLAKTGPSTDVAVDSYGAFAAETEDKIKYIETTDE